MVGTQKLLKELIDQLEAGVHSARLLQAMDEVRLEPTPYEEVYREDKLRLRRYQPRKPRKDARPLLIVYALVNRPSILDLQPDRSLIAGLLREGVPVWLIDWGYPDQADCLLTLDDYINGYLHNCVEEVVRQSGSEQIGLLGVCQGGVFSLCYAALQPHRVAELVTLVTPVDFSTPDNTLAVLAKELDLSGLVASRGNFPGRILTQAYNALLPARLGLIKQLSMGRTVRDHASAANFLRMEKWINDSPDLAGRAFVEFVEAFFQKNRLVSGGLEIGGREVDVGRIRARVLNLYAEQDHLVPPASSAALGALARTEYEEEMLPGGHIGVFAGRQAQHYLPGKIADWLTGQA